MPTISAPNLTKLRSEEHRSQIFLTLASIRTFWEVEVTGSPSRGDTTISFNSGSGIDFSIWEPDMSIWAGSTSGDNDIGELRIKSVTSGDGGVTGTITVALNTLFLQNGDFLSFKLAFPYKPRYSKLAPPVNNPVFLKDSTITYSDQNVNLFPVVIAGGNRSNFLVGGSWIVNPHLEESYVLDGSTITNYSATVITLDGVTSISTINPATGVGTIEFTSVGECYVKYSVTSSNGKIQNSFRYYQIHSSDPSSQFYPFIDFQTKAVSGDWNKGTWNCGISVTDKASLTEIPDKTIAILWARNYYGDTEENITFVPDDSNVLISGFLQKEKISHDTSKDIGEVDFEIVSLTELMKNRFMFSLSLEAVSGTPSEWYQFDSALTVPKALHHLFKWQTNTLEIADFYFGSNTIPRAFVEMEAGSIYDLATGISYKFGIRENIVCDKSGRIFLTPDIQLLTDSERTALITVQEIDTLDKSGKISITRNPVNSVILTKLSGFSWNGTFSTDCAQPLTSPCPNVEAQCSSAETIDPGDEGTGINSIDQQTFLNQTHANELVGRFHAQSNNLYPDITINFSGNYSGVLDINLPEFWTINIGTTDTIREFVWVDQNLILRNVTLNINQEKGTILPTVTFEPEVQGLPGVTTTCLGDWDFDFELPPFPDFNFPDITSPGALITTSDTNSVYYKGATASGWALRTSEDTLDLIQDPFWRVKNSSFEPGNSILFRCGVGFIKRSTDTFITETDVTPATDPPNDAGDAPAPAVEDVEFFMLDGSWITQDYFVVGARWQNASDEWRSWITITDDNGATWSWESIISYIESSPLSTSTQFLFGSGGLLNFSPVPGSDSEIGFVKLDDTNDYYAAVSRQNDNTRHGHLISRSGETLTEQSDVSGVTSTNRFGNSMCRLTDTLFLSANRAVTPLTNLFVDRWTVSGTTVSHTGTLGSSQSPQPTNLKIIRIDDTTAFLIWVAGNPGTAIHGAIIDASAATPTLGTVQTVYSGSSNINIHGLEFAATGEFIVLFSEGTDVKTILFTDSPFSTGTVSTVEAGVGGNFNTEGISPIARITFDASPNVLLIYTQSGTNVMGAILNHTGTAINSISTPVTIVSTTNVTTIAAALNSETEGAVFYRLSNPVNGIASFTISGSTITPIANSTSFGSLGETASRDNNLVWSGEDRYFVAGWAGNSFRGVAIVVYPEVSGGGSWVPSSELNNKILGISIGKGDGLKLYVTMWQPDEILLQVYDLTTFGIIEQYSLGSATEAQVDAYTYIAYPYAIFGDDDTVVVFGRMNGLGQILYSNDSGATLNVEIDDWGSDFCSSYFHDGFQKIAIRTDEGVNSKIYAGNTLSLRSTVPIPHLNPHNMKADFSGTVYILSGESQTLMVISSVPPYLTYKDQTSNHGTAKNGYSLEVL